MSHVCDTAWIGHPQVHQCPPL